MKNLKKILLASHGTEGAEAAEKMALSLLPEGGTLRHLIVVPDFWKGMMGDDWLNNASTQATYGDYLESQLEGEIRQHVDRMGKSAEKNKIKYSFKVVVGKPAQALLEAVSEAKLDLAVIGSPRPKGRKGLRSRMEVETLVRDLPCPLLIVPYPAKKK